MKASKTFEGNTAEVCAQIGKQINSDLMSVSKEKTHETVDKYMSENICVVCKRVYDRKDITYEQRIVVDEAFCPICWHREITTYSDGEMDFSFLEGLVK
jgi:hypothetical protein